MIHILLNASRSTKRVIALAYDITAIPLAMYLALALRHGTFSIRANEDIYLMAAITVAISILAFVKLGL